MAFSTPAEALPARVLTCADVDVARLHEITACYGLQLQLLVPTARLPGSYWGEPEAGLAGAVIYVRGDTPVHSVLHETCHYICMDAGRRAGLHTDAGGDYDEENAVCYLQVLLADAVAECGRERMLRDMDAWGYTFRLGSSRRWFTEDAIDARAWLRRHGLIDDRQVPTGRLRS